MMAKDTNSQLLADFIKSRRLSLGLSMSQAAEQAGLDYSYWTKLEAGSYQTPAPKYLQSIARVLEVPFEDLYGLVGYEVPERLPAFAPYLRSKYELPPEAIDELERYFTFLRSQYDIPADQPVFPPKPKQKPTKSADRSDESGDTRPRRAA